MQDTLRPTTLSGDFIHFDATQKIPIKVDGTGNITLCGKNLFDESYPDIISGTIKYLPLFVGDNTVTMSSNAPYGSGAKAFLLPDRVSGGASTSRNGVWSNSAKTFKAVDGYVTIGYLIRNGTEDPRNYQYMIEIGSTPTAYEAYSGITITSGVIQKSFIGANNIWSDNGSNITVKYWTH